MMMREYNSNTNLLKPQLYMSNYLNIIYSVHCTTALTLGQLNVTNELVQS